MFSQERVIAFAARLRSGGWHRVSELDPQAVSALLVLYWAGVIRYRQDHDGSPLVQWVQPPVVRTEYPMPVFLN